MNNIPNLAVCTNEISHNRKTGEMGHSHKARSIFARFGVRVNLFIVTCNKGITIKYNIIFTRENKGCGGVAPTAQLCLKRTRLNTLTQITYVYFTMCLFKMKVNSFYVSTTPTVFQILNNNIICRLHQAIHRIGGQANNDLLYRRYRMDLGHGIGHYNRHLNILFERKYSPLKITGDLGQSAFKKLLIAPIAAYAAAVCMTLEIVREKLVYRNQLIIM
ncbi:hypothetical protein AGLY_009136 [Aphis glycines]|uniref:Uncharacterized protein n=1 Tax=Aphis glycines TaxID=307491 RepID=A0A6G0TJB6_APHGL|nr:hypothetical protein AGLY_009136 [Aphis glycines]